MPHRRSAEQLTRDALAIWTAGVQAVQGDRLLQNQLRLIGNHLEIPDHDFEIDLSRFNRICVLGAGKAGRAMTLGLEQVLSPVADRFKLFGSVNIPQDGQQTQIDTTGWERFFDLRNRLEYQQKPSRWIELNQVRPPGENRVTALAVRKSNEILEIAENLTNADLCVVLLSGGGSALLSLPIDGIDWKTKNQTIDFLAGHGAPIEHLNQVRSALSRIKGGGLLQRCGAGMVITLVISDVMGDPPATIASGPSVCGPTHLSQPVGTFARQALEVLERYDPERLVVAEPVFASLERQLEPQTKTQPIAVPANKYFIIGNLAVAVDAAGIEAERRGYSHVMHIQPTENQRTGTSPPIAESEGEHFASMLHSMQNRPGPDCLITGGEPVVNLAGATTNSLGGRNLQLALAALSHWLDKSRTREDENESNFCFVSGGTDGEDGPTPVAGAVVGNPQIWQAISQGNNPNHYLQIKDAYHFFRNNGGLLLTAATGTNVCDLRVGVVDRIQPQGKRATD